MKKIVSLFQRNYDGDRLVRNEVVPGAEWVIAGDGSPTMDNDALRQGLCPTNIACPTKETAAQKIVSRPRSVRVGNEPH